MVLRSSSFSLAYLELLQPLHVGILRCFVILGNGIVPGPNFGEHSNILGRPMGGDLHANTMLACMLLCGAHVSYFRLVPLAVAICIMTKGHITVDII